MLLKFDICIRTIQKLVIENFQNFKTLINHKNFEIENEFKF